MEEAIVTGVSKYGNVERTENNTKLKHFFDEQIKPKLKNNSIVEFDDTNNHNLLHMMYFFASKLGVCAKISYADNGCRYYFWVED